MKGSSTGRYDETFAGEDVEIATNAFLMQSLLVGWCILAFIVKSSCSV